MKQYKAVLFHPEGDFVTDFKGKPTVGDVWDAVNEMGSRWIFYPIPFVCTDTKIVDTPEGLEWMKGRKIKTVQDFFTSTWPNRREQICDMLNNGAPLSLIYGK
jgi:hypothetical protein